MLRSLESRIGARLVERTSRSVRLTPLGASLRDELTPAYTALLDVVEAARARARGVGGVLRIGFLGSLDEEMTGLVRAFQRDHPGCEVHTVEVPLADPFGPVRDGDVDAAIVLAPVREPGLARGPSFSEAPLSLAVPSRHPFADRPSVPAEDLAGHPLIRIAGPAPRYWREAQSPRLTPGGRAIPSGPAVGTTAPSRVSAPSPAPSRKASRAAPRTPPAAARRPGSPGRGGRGTSSRAGRGR
ncbi:hypothetical protein GCM10009727_49080 [Actinomadura napierensis]|uniref:HTH lysR-type domain-containing protein n=1 Tax=Actinomadura napierensis TaxID=267854 RepID=A0ABN2ZTB8_9ACTN